MTACGSSASCCYFSGCWWLSTGSTVLPQQPWSAGRLDRLPCSGDPVHRDLRAAARLADASPATGPTYAGGMSERQLEIARAEDGRPGVNQSGNAPQGRRREVRVFRRQNQHRVTRAALVDGQPDLAGTKQDASKHAWAAVSFDRPGQDRLSKRRARGRSGKLRGDGVELTAILQGGVGLGVPGVDVAGPAA